MIIIIPMMIIIMMFISETHIVTVKKQLFPNAVHYIHYVTQSSTDRGQPAVECTFSRVLTQIFWVSRLYSVVEKAEDRYEGADLEL